jgi:hypothetical protein
MVAKDGTVAGVGLEFLILALGLQVPYMHACTYATVRTSVESAGVREQPPFNAGRAKRAHA